MSYFFDVSKYTQVPQPGGWDALNSALNAIREKRLREDLQTQAEAHQARQNELQRGAVLQSQITEEGNRRFAVGEANRRADAQGAATAAEKAMLAEQAGQYGAADAIVAGAAPTGLRSAFPVQGAPEAPQTQLRMPEMRADRTPQVAPQMAMGAQLRQPMTQLPGAQSALWAAIQRERGQLSLGDQGRQIGAMGQDVNALTPPVPDLQQNERVFSQNGNVLGRTNREESMRQRIAQARALAAPGALSSTPLAATAAGKAQQHAEELARAGADPQAAISTRTDALKMIGGGAAREAANERAEMMGTRTGEVSDRMRDRTLEQRVVQAVNTAKTADVRDAASKLTQSVAGARAGNPAAMGAIPIQLARVVQGAGQVSNADADAMKGTQFYNYLTSVEDWVGRKVASDPSWTPESDPSGAPPVSVEFLTAFADDIVNFKSLQMARLFQADMKFAMDQPFVDEGYRDGATNYIRRMYADIVSDDDIAAAEANDAAYAARKRGRRQGGGGAPPMRTSTSTTTSASERARSILKGRP